MDRETNRFVQVCRGADQEVEAPGPAKTGTNSRFRWCLRDSLHWEGKGRGVLGVETWHAHSGRAEQGDLSESAPKWGGTIPWYPPTPAQPKPQKRGTKGRKSVFFRGWGGRFKKKKRRAHQWMPNFGLSSASLSHLFIAPPTIGKQ